MKLEENRKNHIDLIEFIAIFFVIFYHAQTNDYNFISDTKVSNYFIYIFKTILSTGAPLFFFVNGYLILNKKFELKKHIKKTVKLLVLTIIWGIIGLLLISKIINQPIVIKDFLNNLWTWRPIGWINHLWYMSTLICIYIFFPLIKEVYDKNRNIFKYIIVVSFIFVFINSFLCELATIVLNFVFKTGKIYSINLFNNFNPFREIHGYALVYFCLGGLIYDFEEKIKSVKAWKRNLFAIIGLLVSSICWGSIGIYFSKLTGTVWDPVWTGYDTIFTLVNVVLIYILSLNYGIYNKVIYYISCSTLGIYFMHNIFIRATFSHVITIPLLTTVLGNIIYAGAILIVCLLITLIIKKIPVIKNLVS